MTSLDPGSGVCDVPHVPLTRHHPQQGDPAVLPAVHVVSLEVTTFYTHYLSLIISLIRSSLLQMLRADHQDRVPSRHRKAVGQEGQTVNEKVPLTAAFLQGLSSSLSRMLLAYKRTVSYVHPCESCTHARIKSYPVCENK